MDKATLSQQDEIGGTLKGFNGVKALKGAATFFKIFVKS